MIVVDASVVVDVLLRRPDAEALQARILQPNEMMHAPHLIDVEVLHVLRRFVLRGAMVEQRGREAVQDLHALPIVRHAHGPLLTMAWQLRDNISAYDAVYVALADALNAKLLTRDRRLASAAGQLVAAKLV